jgi:hypothetical protein
VRCRTFLHRRLVAQRPSAPPRIIVLRARDMRQSGVRSSASSDDFARSVSPAPPPPHTPPPHPLHFLYRPLSFPSKPSAGVAGYPAPGPSGPSTPARLRPPAHPPQQPPTHPPPASRHHTPP